MMPPTPQKQSKQSVTETPPRNPYVSGSPCPSIVTPPKNLAITTSSSSSTSASTSASSSSCGKTFWLTLNRKTQVSPLHMAAFREESGVRFTYEGISLLKQYDGALAAKFLENERSAIFNFALTIFDRLDEEIRTGGSGNIESKLQDYTLFYTLFFLQEMIVPDFLALSDLIKYPARQLNTMRDSPQKAGLINSFFQAFVKRADFELSLLDGEYFLLFDGLLDPKVWKFRSIMTCFRNRYAVEQSSIAFIPQMKESVETYHNICKDRGFLFLNGSTKPEKETIAISVEPGAPTLKVKKSSKKPIRKAPEVGDGEVVIAEERPRRKKIRK